MEERTFDDILEGLSQGEVDFQNFQMVGEESNGEEIDQNETIHPEQGDTQLPSRLQAVTSADIDSVLSNQQNANTKRKTHQDMSVFRNYLLQSGGGRLPEVIPPNELDIFISKFLLSVRNKDGTEYEPTTIGAYMSSLDRYFKVKSYPVAVMTDIQFTKYRNVLQTKQKQLKGLGKGNKPRAAHELTDSELNHLYKTKTLGSSSPVSVLYSLWMVCISHFGMRPGKDTHDLKWGDVELKTDVESGSEYIMYSQERQTKPRTGSNPRDPRTVKPRAYAIPDDRNKDPVALYKLYASKRPAAMNDPDQPFFLTINKDADLCNYVIKIYTAVIPKETVTKGQYKYTVCPTCFSVGI